MSDEKSIGDIVQLLKLPSAPSRPLVRAAAPLPTQEDLRTDTVWFPVLRTMFGGGLAAKLGPFPLAAYLALKAGADFRSGSVTASYREIARRTGMSVRKAQDAVERLHAHGLIRVATQAGRRTQFQLVEHLPITDRDGNPRAIVQFDFNASEFTKLVREAASAAMNELRRDQRSGSTPPITINIGSLNVLVTTNSGE